MKQTEPAPLTSRAQVIEWLAEATAAAQMRVKEVALEELKHWRFEAAPLRLAHDSGQFFRVIGIRHWATFGARRTWDQPMIDQPEVGILGFLTKNIDGEQCLLAQAKVEPGNSAGAQLAPTVQATRSNYTKVHGGRVPAYLPYFRDLCHTRVLLDQMHSEQASRFLYKRNRNMLIEVDEEVPVLPGFRWVPWRLVCDLLRMDNQVNMDARSVLSCMRQDWADTPREESLQRLLRWFTALRADFPRRTMIVGLNELSGWNIGERSIHRPDSRFFSVIGIEAEILNREVTRWHQPLFKHHGKGMNGMIVQPADGVLRFLIRGCCYPGSVDNFELGSTVSLSDYEARMSEPDQPLFFEYFTKPGAGQVLYASVQCEEGGRFLHYQNLYTIVELKEGTIGTLPEGFCWMTLGEIHALLPHGYFSIEARNLLACLHAV